MFADLLLPMFDDEYYPDILVAEVKQHVETFAKKILCTRQISQNPYPIRILPS